MSLYYLYAKYKDKVAFVSKHLSVLEALEIADAQVRHHGEGMRFFISREDYRTHLSYSALGTQYVEDKRKANASKTN